MVIKGLGGVDNKPRKLVEIKSREEIWYNPQESRESSWFNFPKRKLSKKRPKKAPRRGGEAR